MDAKAFDLSQILSGDQNQYIIPLFQRYYSWTENHWKQLWSDIEEVLDNYPHQKHFLGPLVCMTLGNDMPNELREYHVIDGQQRLTTLTLLLCALRDTIKDCQVDDSRLSKLSANIEENYLIHEHREDLNHYRLVPRTKDREIFFKLIDAEAPKSDSSLVKCYKYLKRAIEQRFADDGSAPKTLENLFTIISRSLPIVMITVGKEENAFEIFESLNTTGLRLSEADLIRNFFFMQVDLDEQDRFEEKVWKPFEDLFQIHTDTPDTTLATAFYRDYLMQQRGQYVSPKAVYVEFRKWVETEIEQQKPVYDESQNHPQFLVDDMKHFARLYLDVRAGRASSPEIADSFKRIQQLEISTSYPLVLSLYERYDKKQLSQSDLLSMLRMLESFVLRRSICGESTRGYGRMFVAALRQENSVNPNALRNFLIERGWPNDERFVESLQTFPLYERERKKCSLVLKELELTRSHKERILPETLTLEHVMPQTLNDEWISMLDIDNLTAENINSHLHVLGNMTFTGYNSEMGNKPFSEKKEQMRNSHLELNRYFLGLDYWNISSIQERGYKLAQEVAKLWPHPSANN